MKIFKALKTNLLYPKKRRWSSFQNCKSPIENFHMLSTLVEELLSFIFFKKKLGKRTSSESKLNVNAAGTGTGTGSASTTDQELNINTELEALHLSRTDNPYIEILSSQDNLDQSSSYLPQNIMAPPMSETEKSSSVMMSPESISPTRSYAGSKEYSLSEIHSHLVRSPPPINWPLSPR